MTEKKSLSLSNINDEKLIPFKKLRNWGLNQIVKSFSKHIATRMPAEYGKRYSLRKTINIVPH